jgi:heme/copper-type cytochrome/quinol oxidase subunit 2
MVRASIAHNTAAAAVRHPARVLVTRLAALRVPRHISPIIPTFLSDAIFWLAAACCVFAQAAIVRSALRARAQRPDGSASPSRPIEVVWTIVPAIMLAVVLVLTWRALHPAAAPTIVP